MVEFMYLVITRMPGEIYRRRLRSLLFGRVTSFSINELPCLLIPLERSKPLSISDFNWINLLAHSFIIRLSPGRIFVLTQKKITPHLVSVFHLFLTQMSTCE